MLAELGGASAPQLKGLAIQRLPAIDREPSHGGKRAFPENAGSGVMFLRHLTPPRLGKNST